MRHNTMKTIYASLLSTCILTTVFFSGCIEETGPYGDPNTFYVSLDGDYEYTSIQQAIDDAPENYTVYVLPGYYNESVIINKTISLIGEDVANTIINANYSGDVIKVTGPGNVTVTGFTLINSGKSTNSADYDSGIDIHCDGNKFSHLIVRNNRMGIWSYSSSNNQYTNITLTNNSYYGMYLYSSSNSNVINYCVFYKNEATSGYAFRIKTSKNNVVKNSYFGENARGLYFCCGARDNIVYHNTFENNQQWNARDDVGNRWYNGEELTGNYWSDYGGVDEDNDGIGDTPYNVSSGSARQDSYPLMQPIITYSP
jgi:parallel beta-helix repeat protein